MEILVVEEQITVGLTMSKLIFRYLKDLLRLAKVNKYQVNDRYEDDRTHG